jgi:hypothetical protein
VLSNYSGTPKEAELDKVGRANELSDSDRICYCEDSGNEHHNREDDNPIEPEEPCISRIF